MLGLHNGFGCCYRPASASRRRRAILYQDICGPKAETFLQRLQRQNAFGDAGWSSPVARQAHNLKVVGSNPTPATKLYQ